MKLSLRGSGLLVLCGTFACGPSHSAVREAAALTSDGGFGAAGAGASASASGGAGGSGSAGSGGERTPAAGGATGAGGDGPAPAQGGVAGGASAGGGGADAHAGSDGADAHAGSDGEAPQPPPDAGTGGNGGDDAAPIALATPPRAADLLARLTTCQELTTGRYPADTGASASVAICGLTAAVYWKADLDVNCNGKSSAVCNLNTDPGYQPETSGTDSKGGFLDPATLPFVVIPKPSSRFDYRQHGITVGNVVAVIFKGRVEYGVFAEEGSATLIGEASYAMAKALGIDPDPATGGVGSGVSYVVFTGPSGRVTKMEDHDEAVRIGQARALELLR